MILVPGEVPVDPDATEAREWLLEELGDDSYAAPPAELPQWLEDIIAWLRSLFERIGDGTRGAGDAGGILGVVVVVVLVAAILVVAFLLFGLPRLRATSAVTGELFGENDDRPAAEIRTVAERAAAAGDYTTAVVEIFRALARSLAERGLVHAFPGTTAQEFARRAGTPFPRDADGLRAAAGTFDRVRYLGFAGTAHEWERMHALDRSVRAAKPVTGVRAEDAFAGSPR